MGVNKQFKRTLLSAAFALGFTAAGTASATNWVMLQGTEPAAASVPAKAWGFIQVNYQKDYSDPNSTGGMVPAKLLGPNLNAQSGINLSHLQFGLRGTGFPLDEHINYFLLVEAGNAGTNVGGNSTTGISSNNGAVATDASVTLNYLKGARVRVGLFKYPGADEGLQSLTSMEYINFSEATNFLLLERFPNAGFTACALPTVCTVPLTATGNTDAYTINQLQNGAGLNKFVAPAGGFRDTGVQVFDSFDIGTDWDLTYAAMVGNGNGLQWNNVDGKYDTYLYLSTEKKLGGGAGAYVNGLKFFAWNQSGQRLLDNTNDSIGNAQLYDRKRSGVGVKYIGKPYRVTFEYIDAKGMIFEGPDKPNFYLTNTAAGNGADAEANGWYLDGGWYIPGTKWELDARYDTMDKNIGRVDEHTFSKWTAGVQYIYSPMSRVTLNYEMRDYKCNTSSAQCTGATANFAGVNNKLSMQVTSAF
jgi:hypothetical protein